MKRAILVLAGVLMWQGAGASIGDQAEVGLKVENGYLQVADALATSHNKYGACGPVEAYTSEIVSAVQAARYAFDGNWEYNEKTNRKFKITSETSKALKTTLALKDIMNMLDHKDASSFEHALNRVVMWGPAPGAYGNMSYIEFGANNKVETGYLELLNDYPYTKWTTTEGTFKVHLSKGDIVVSLMVNGSTQEYFLSKNYEWEEMWVLIPVEEPKMNPWMGGYTDFPSECEA